MMVFVVIFSFFKSIFFFFCFVVTLVDIVHNVEALFSLPFLNC